jgi:hypothetical protein
MNLVFLLHAASAAAAVVAAMFVLPSQFHNINRTEVMGSGVMRATSSTTEDCKEVLPHVLHVQGCSS